MLNKARHIRGMAQIRTSIPIAASDLPPSLIGLVYPSYMRRPRGGGHLVTGFVNLIKEPWITQIAALLDEYADLYQSQESEAHNQAYLVGLLTQIMAHVPPASLPTNLVAEVEAALKGEDYEPVDKETEG